jgi:hypothetical protein
MHYSLSRVMIIAHVLITRGRIEPFFQMTFRCSARVEPIAKTLVANTGMTHLVARICDLNMATESSIVGVYMVAG